MRQPIAAYPSGPDASSWATVTRLADLPPGWWLVNYAVLRDDALAVIVTDVDLTSKWRRIDAAPGAVDPPSRMAAMVEGATAMVLTWDGAGWRGALRVPLDCPWLTIDRFPDGRWLVVGTATEGAPNARIVAPDGTLLRRVMLHGGISHVAITANSRIWVGWFDEGILRGYGMPDRPATPAAEGMACFDETGVPRPSLPLLPVEPGDLPLENGMGYFADCYALTVVGEEAWASPYTSFPLLRVSEDGAVRRWRNDLATGVRALAVAGDHVLIAGGYAGDTNRLLLVALGREGRGEAVQGVGRWALPFSPDLEWAWTPPSLMVGRGDMPHLVDDGRWWRWSVSDALAQVVPD